MNWESVARFRWRRSSNLEYFMKFLSIPPTISKLLRLKKLQTLKLWNLKHLTNLHLTALWKMGRLKEFESATAHESPRRGQYLRSSHNLISNICEAKAF